LGSPREAATQNIKKGRLFCLSREDIRFAFYDALWLLPLYPSPNSLEARVRVRWTVALDPIKIKNLWRSCMGSLYGEAYDCVFFKKKIVFRKLFFKFFYIYLLLKKLIYEKYFPVNGKYFPIKEKFDLVSRKVFSFYFGRKTLSGSYEKFRNVILFADYIKFGPQTFDCYIYFVFNIYFSISSLKI